MNKNDLIILEECNNDIHQVECLLKILDEHFECERCDDVVKDWYSLQYLFAEYRQLNNAILKIVATSQEKLQKLINDVFPNIDVEEENE